VTESPSTSFRVAINESSRSAGSCVGSRSFVAILTVRGRTCRDADIASIMGQSLWTGARLPSTRSMGGDAW